MSVSQEQATGLVAYLNRAGLIYAMEGQGAVWADALWNVNYPDAQEACRQLVRGGPMAGRIATPADVVSEVRRVRRARIAERMPPEPPDGIGDDMAASLRFGRVYLAALGDGDGEAAADARACAVVGAVRQLSAGPTRDPRAMIEQAARATRVPDEG